MKNVFLLLTSVLLILSCSRSEKPIDKHAIIQAYKDSVTLDSLRKVKAISSSNSFSSLPKAKTVRVNGRRVSNKDYNAMLAFKYFYDDFVNDNRFTLLDDTLRSSLNDEYLKVSKNLKEMDKTGFEFDKKLFDKYYNEMDLGVDSILLKNVVDKLND